MAKVVTDKTITTKGQVAILKAKMGEKLGTKVTNNMAKVALDSYHEMIMESLASGVAVKTTGYGTYEVRERGSRAGVNPQTKQAITIDAYNAPVFKASSVMKDAVNA